MQQAGHRRDDAALLDEFDLPCKNLGVSLVESHNEPALHLQPRALDALHVGDQVALLILALVALGQTRIDSLGNARRAVCVCLFMGFIFPNLALRLKPILTCLAIAAASLLVEFIGSLGDLRCKIERLLGQQ